jgi:general secretion pathway protein G
MTFLHHKPAARRGFTLIELLVVISVIAVLVALVAAAVMNLLIKGPAVQDRADISALTGALQQFKAKYGFYPPSRVFLANKLKTYTDNASDKLVQESLATLSSMFPNMNWNGVDWTGGLGMPKSGTVVLEGDQCLVFFLGGIPTNANGTNACLGFSTSTTNPTAAGGQRFKFYDFQPGRLTSIHGNNFFSYLNAYGSPPVGKEYAYFSTSKRGQNQYNSSWVTGTGATSRGTGLGVMFVDAAYRNSDCNFTATSLKVNPYASVWVTTGSGAVTFINPDSFQLISAGADGKFGPGTSSAATIWTPSNPMASVNGPGADDTSNFSDRVLGATQ